MAVKPPYSAETVYAGLMQVQTYLNSLGITSVQDAIVDIAKGGQYSVLPMVGVMGHAMIRPKLIHA